MMIKKSITVALMMLSTEAFSNEQIDCEFYSQYCPIKQERPCFLFDRDEDGEEILRLYAEQCLVPQQDKEFNPSHLAPILSMLLHD